MGSRVHAIDYSGYLRYLTWLWRASFISTQTLLHSELTYCTLALTLDIPVYDQALNHTRLQIVADLYCVPAMADRQQHSQDPSPSPTSSSSTSNTAPSRSSLESPRSPPSRNPSLRLSSMPSSASQHRQSFSESLRGLPPSPRSQRQPSLSQQAVQDLIDNPPAQKSADTSFSGRDWRSISIAELVTPEDLKFVELDTGVEAATNVG